MKRMMQLVEAHQLTSSLILITRRNHSRLYDQLLQNLPHKLFDLNMIPLFSASLMFLRHLHTSLSKK